MALCVRSVCIVTSSYFNSAVACLLRELQACLFLHRYRTILTSCRWSQLLVAARRLAPLPLCD